MDTDRKVKLGKLFLGQGRDDEGREVLDRAVRQSSQGERSGILRKVAEAFMEANHFGEAEELFIKLLKLNPEEVETYNRLGIALRRQGKYDEAEAYYRLALETHPRNPVIHYNLGVLQFSRQERENARNSLMEAIRLDPAFTKAREMLRQVEASA
jgi:Flp pilus assembly protein TadD